MGRYRSDLTLVIGALVVLSVAAVAYPMLPDASPGQASQLLIALAGVPLLVAP